MGQRIVCLPPTSAGECTPAIVDDGTILARARSGSMRPALLYFSQADYDQSIRNLTPEQVREVVAKRLRYWSPNALAHGVDWIYQAARRSLALAALASAASGAPRKLLEYFHGILDLMAGITGNGRYDALSLASLLVGVLQGDAKLSEELMEAVRVEGNAANALLGAGAAEAQQTFQSALGDVLSRLGRPEFGAAAPYVELRRAIFLSQPSDDFIEGLQKSRESFVMWRDGLVMGCGARRLQDFAQLGQTVQILYFNAGKFLQDLQELTPAQREREFAARLEGGRGASAKRPARASGDPLPGAASVSPDGAGTRAAGNAAAAAVLGVQTKEEEERLRAVLVAPAGTAASRAAGAPLELLSRLEQEIGEDAIFFGLSSVWPASLICNRSSKQSRAGSRKP